MDYSSAGVDAIKKESGLKALLEYVNRTFAFNPCKPLLPIGYYANVIDLRPAGLDIGIAFSTDGVGTKLLVAEMMNKYDTVGIDCVAMNVNDLICVGAKPISMVDYIAISEANSSLLAELAKGLYDGCQMAGVNLSGGELAQVADLLAKKEGKTTFDIVGTAIGIVKPSEMIIGKDLEPGQILVGLESSGLHSNGYSLARKICFDTARLNVDSYRSELNRTIGEELLEPTRIYVKEVLQMIEDVPVKALFHITGDGLFNLTRTSKAVGFEIDYLPETPPIFRFLREQGNIAVEEMFRVFNMGIGLVLVVPDQSGNLEKIQSIASSRGYQAHRLGRITEDSDRTITVLPYKIKGKAGVFQKF